MLKTFSIGGVHPHENKLSAHQPIIKAEIPAKAAILLGQHIGAPAKPIVAKGDVVKVGTKIAEPGGFVSAAIHSSVSGKVAKIDTIVDASGYAKPAIFIDVEGDEWEESIDRSETLVKECSLTSEEIVKKIADAGIVGLGGALPYAGQVVSSSCIQGRVCHHQRRRVRTVSDCRPSADAGTCGRNYGRCIHSDEGGKGEQGIHRH